MGTLEPYDRSRRNFYEKVHHGPTSDTKDTFVRIHQMEYLQDILYEQRVFVARIVESKEHPEIDIDKPPKN